jgi:UDP-glucose 4-epimerase
MRKMLVTGGAGFIGHHLVRALVERGDEVIVIDTFFEGKKPERIVPGARYEEIDILSTEALEARCAGVDTVFHTAAIPRVPYSIEHPVATTDVNITGTASVLTAAARAKVRRVVYSASGSAYGLQETLPLVETMPANPVNPYGLQKYVGELYAKLWADTYGIETVSLRYFNVYGPGIDPYGPYALAVGAFLLARKEGRPLTIFGDGTITRDYTHVRDVVAANILASESQKAGKGEVINIGAGRKMTIQALAELFVPENERATGIVYTAPRIEAHDSEADNRKAKELLGWSPTIPLEEGIAELKEEWGLA